MKTNIISKLTIEGLHNWPDANDFFPEVGFLSNEHRHKWYITLVKKVNHDDRDVEFIMFQRDVIDYLKDKYYNNTKRTHVFGAMSCEMLAKELLIQFDCERVIVMEDDENGAEIYK